MHFQSQNFLGSSKKVAPRKVSSFYIWAYDVLKIQIHESLGEYLMTKKDSKSIPSVAFDTKDMKYAGGLVAFLVNVHYIENNS